MHQVLCITHLPQLAAFGDQHYTVNKHILSENGSERTTTLVNTLAGDARTTELMQMLGATTPAGRRSRGGDAGRGRGGKNKGQRRLSSPA